MPTFSEYAAVTSLARQLKASTAKKERSIWRRIESVFGDWPLNTIAPSDVRRFVESLTADGLSPAYVRDIYSLLAMTFDYAIADELIAQTPCVKVTLPKRVGRSRPLPPVTLVHPSRRLISAMWRWRSSWLEPGVASVGQPCRFHDLRHTHAALLIAANTHPKLLQARLGHSSIKTTLDIYGHLYEPLDEIAADRLEQLIADAIAHRTRAERGLEL